MNHRTEQFNTDGYIIVDILTPAEVADYRAALNKLFDEAAQPADRDEHSASYQHFGDDLATFGTEARQYYVHVLTSAGTEAIHSAYHHPRVLEVVTELLGPDLVVDNASLFAFNPGAIYRLGWHRDVIQIPPDEIDDQLFSPDRIHNNVQINLPLIDEHCLEVVPGSHRRPNTDAENDAFSGSRHYAPLDAEMPGAIEVGLAAGQAVFYNNNLIHRGVNLDPAATRRTFHMGYHSASLPPTWHFYLLDSAKLTDEQLRTMNPDLRTMMERHIRRRAEFPAVEDSWRR